MSRSLREIRRDVDELRRLIAPRDAFQVVVRTLCPSEETAAEHRECERRNREAEVSARSGPGGIEVVVLRERYEDPGAGDVATLPESTPAPSLPGASGPPGGRGAVPHSANGRGDNYRKRKRRRRRGEVLYGPRGEDT